MEHLTMPDERVEGAPLTLLLPLLPGQSEPWRRLLQELQASRRPAFVAACRRWLVCSLAVWLAPARPADLVVAQFRLAGSLADSEERFEPSQDAFDCWIVERVRVLHGLDLRAGLGRYRAELQGIWPDQAQSAMVRLPTPRPAVPAPESSGCFPAGTGCSHETEHDAEWSTP